MLPKILIIIIIAVLGFFGLRFLSTKLEIKPHGGLSQQGSGPRNCLDKKDAKLGVSPLSADDLSFITPLGRMGDSHVTPTDHQYWIPKNAVFVSDNTKLPTIYEIYAPADGVITQLERHTEIPSDNPNVPKIDDWRIIIYHSCSLYSIFIHVDKLTDEIFKASGAPEIAEKGNKSYPANIEVKEGQVIGKLSAHSFDFSVHDNNVVLKGLSNQKRYEGEFWKIHTVDPFDYFKEPIRSQLTAKVVRSIPPLGGKIDYDIEGKLVGNWFRKGDDSFKKHEGRFWDGELSIAYDEYDPSRIFISTGNFNGRAGQFAVKGNSPDPGDAGVGQLVKYELVNHTYVNGGGNNWDQRAYASGVKLAESSEIRGVVLFQLIDNKTLKVEFFPDKTSSQNLEFDSSAQIYER